MLTTLTQWLKRESGLRFLARRKAACAVAVITMAVALGANTLVFSVTRAFLLNSFGVPEPNRLFVIAPVRELPGRGVVVFAEAYVNYQRIRETQRSFADVSVQQQSVASWEADGEARPLQAARVSASFFTTVRVQPALGRTFRPDEEGPGADPVVIISHALWQGALAGERAVIGRSMRINGAAHTVVGVMPPGFAQPLPTEIWLPFDLLTPNAWTAVTGARNLGVLGRVKDDVSIDAARAEMETLTKRAIEATPDNREFRYTLQSIRQVLLPGADRTLLMVQVGALVLVLLAISNLASLLIAWGFERRQEISVRLALGAEQGRVMRMLVVQSIVVVTLGGIAGLAVAQGAVPLVRGLDVSPALAIFFAELRVDALVLVVSALAIGVAGVLAGVLPAWLAGRANLADSLRASSRSSSLSRAALRWQKAMVFGQATLAVVIVCAAALVGLSFRNLLQVPSGFDVTDRVVARIQLSGEQYSRHPVRVEFATRLLQNLEQERALSSAAFTSTLPVGDQVTGGRFFLDPADAGTDREPMLLHFRRISNNYHQTIGIPLLQGRPFDSRDRADGKAVAIISSAVAKRLWPSGNAVGQLLYRVQPNQPPAPLEVVGVVGNVPDAGFNAPVGETVYVPFQQISQNQMSIVASSEGGPDVALAAIRRALRITDPVVAANNPTTLHALLNQANALPRLQTILLLAFALVAITMVVLGSYGVMSQLVMSREREFALRMLFGAAPLAIGSKVLAQAARLTIAGAASGIVAVWLMNEMLQPLLFGLQPRSVPVLLVGAAVVLMLAAAAAVPSALRAMSFDTRAISKAA